MMDTTGRILAKIASALAEAQRRATVGDKTPVRVTAGYYFVIQDAELVEINRNTELAGTEKWMLYGPDWNSDPYMTFRECLAALRG